MVRAMRIPYRFTSAIAATACFALILADLLPKPPQLAPAPKVTVTSPNAISFNPCMMWPQIGPVERLVGAILMGAFVLFVVQGFRNRSPRRWIALAGVAGLPIFISYNGWWIRAVCFGRIHLWTLGAWSLTTMAMFLHHAIVRPSCSGGLPSSDRFAVAPTNDTALDRIIATFRAISLPLVVFGLLGLAFLEQFRGLAYYQGGSVTYEVITLACRVLGYVEVVLCVLVGLAWMHHTFTATQRHPAA